MLGKHVRRFVGHFNKVKDLGRSAYQAGRAVAHAIDHGASVIHRTHEALAPLLQNSEAGRSASRSIKSGLGDFAHLKTKATRAHRAVEDASTRVRTALPEYSF